MSFRARNAFCSASGMDCHCSCGLNQPAWNTDAVGTSHGALCQASSARWGRMGARAGSIPCRMLARQPQRPVHRTRIDSSIALESCVIRRCHEAMCQASSAQMGTWAPGRAASPVGLAHLNCGILRNLLCLTIYFVIPTAISVCTG